MITTWKVAVLAALTSASIASPALAQSAGTAADRARAGYPSPYGSGYYAHAPGRTDSPEVGHAKPKGR
jgi:hypothetical protein